MVDETTVNVTLTAELSLKIKETIQKVADLSGETLNQFLISSTLKEAYRILEEYRVIFLSEKDAEKVFTLLKNSPSLNEQLIAAVKKHKEYL